MSELFDSDLITRLKKKPVGRLAWAVPEFYTTVLAPEREKQRVWMRSELHELPEPGRSRLKARLENERDFGTAYHELCVSAILRDAGYCAEFEPEVFGTTPDLLVRSEPPLMIELWTRSRPDSVKKANRAWEVFAGLINKIPVPAALMIVGPSREAVSPPDSRKAKIVARSLREWLLSGTAEGVFTAGDYEFAIIGQMPGLYAGLAPPYGGGNVDSDMVIEAISEKTSKYRAAASELKAALVVVLASEPSAALSLDLLKSALAGKQTLSFSFSVGLPGQLASSKVRMRATETPEVFDPALSAIGWLNPGIPDPGSLVMIPAIGANQPLPALTSARVTTEVVV